MEIDGALVMDSFIDYMGDLFLLMLIGCAAAAIVAAVFSYFEHHRGSDSE
tara:strand:+ start:66 stop:215 length:150 start_codon:yes stop_codon:yes gene_type:complete